MNEINVTWGSAAKVAWSIGWRLMLYLIPAYVLAIVTMIVAMMASDSVQGSIPLFVAGYYVLQGFWVIAVALAFLVAVKHVIGKSYSKSSFPLVQEEFRITLVSDQ